MIFPSMILSIILLLASSIQERTDPILITYDISDLILASTDLVYVVIAKCYVAPASGSGTGRVTCGIL